jgi:replication factor C subunit 2/4
MDKFVKLKASENGSRVEGEKTIEESKVSKRRVPWIEKYRPKRVDEISHQDEVVSALKSSLTSGNVSQTILFIFHIL